MPTTYAEAATKLAAIEEEVDTTSTRLRSLRFGLARQFGIPAEGHLGLVPEPIRKHTDYQYSKAAYDLAFQKLRTINTFILTHHKAEHRRAMEALRQARRSSQLAEAA